MVAVVVVRSPSKLSDLYMCISANVSISTFVISIISSLVLIYYGEPRWKTENIIIGTFFIYVAIVQLLEWMMWVDLDGKIGINRVATLVTPIYVYVQPLVLYNIEAFLYGVVSPWWWLLVEFLYLIVTVLQYREFVKGDVLVTKCGSGSAGGILDWVWVHYYNMVLYFGVFVFAIFAFMATNIAMLCFIIGLAFLLLSIAKYGGHGSSFFCFISAFAPIAFLFGESFL